jgi:hypothetical protein
MQTRGLAIAVALLFAPTPAVSAPVSEVVTVEVRSGVTMRCLAIPPTGQPRAAVILLAGGNGALRLSPSGSIVALGGNFLIRSRDRFARHELFVAALEPRRSRSSPAVVPRSRLHAKRSLPTVTSA